MPESKYHLPAGFSFVKSTLNAANFLRDPILFFTKRMEEFNGTYSPSLTPTLKAIVTQDADFISYLIRENHRNYKKSDYLGKSASEFFGNGLLFSNGGYWLKQRRLIQPAFHREKLQGLYQLIIKTIDDFLVAMPTGASVDVYPLMHELAFKIVINSLFDISLPREKIEAIAALFTDIQQFFVKDTTIPVRRIFYPFTREKKKYLDKAVQLRAAFGAIVKERKRSGESRNDLLDMLLNSRYEDSGEAMTEEQILDEATILIFAGHETTANALSWLLYSVAGNEAVQDKLKKEIAGISIAASVQNDFIKACINESMRLFPPVWLVERSAVEDDQFGNYRYPRGILLISFLYGLHHDKNFWPDAERFIPERFIKEPDLVKSKYFYPFGAGPRMCIGNNFAMAEMSFFIHRFFTEFTVKTTNQVPKKVPLLTLRPDKILLEIQCRS